MAPKRALAYIRSFELPEDQERYIIEMDIRDKSQVETALKYNVSPETVKKKRRLAYVKIADAIRQNA